MGDDDEEALIRSAEQIFRYAPLSSGLDIVRKTLGRHEIATVQATAIDRAIGIVNVTTILAHSSGEWNSSDWPVCSLEDMASPKRMGAALTYARRYSLFALVGIAGEDDLDAPDLNAAEPDDAPLNGPSQANGDRKHHRRKIVNSANAVLESQLLAVLRDQLLGELKEVGSLDAAAIWARRILQAKNSLNIVDATQLEHAFQAKLAALASEADNSERQPPPFGSVHTHAKSLQRKGSVSTKSSTNEGVKTSAPAHSEPRRVRDREHMKYRRRISLFDLRPASCRSSPPPICPEPSARTQGT